MASIDNLIVQNRLRTSLQSGGTLHLKGTGSRQPAVEKALVVQGGGTFAGIVTVGTLDVGANATVYGEVTADGGFGDVTTSAVTLDGVLTCPAVSTPAFAQQYFVAPGGNNTTGNGTVANPFATVGAAIAAAYAAAGSSACIVLAAGTYTEDVSIDSSVATDITIVGSGREEVLLQGNVAIGKGTPSSISVPGTVSILGLSIFGKIWDISELADNELVISNCNVTDGGIVFYSYDGESNVYGTLRMTNCNVTCTENQNPFFVDAALFCYSKHAILNNCQFTYVSTTIEEIYRAQGATVSALTSIVNDCTFNLALANDFVHNGFSCFFNDFFYSPEATLTLKNCTVNLQITNVIGYLLFSISGVYTNAAYSYVIDNTFNVQRGIGGFPAVYNYGISTYTQGNVALPGSLTGYGNATTPLVTI